MRSWVACACGLLALGGCGSRTGLLVTLGVEGAEDAGPALDAGAPSDATPSVDARVASPIYALLPAQAPEGVYTYLLLEFDPPAGIFAPPEPLSCLAAVGDRPIAVAPRCDGSIFVAFAGGSIWRIDAGTRNCTVLDPGYRAQNLEPPQSLTFGISPEQDERLYLVTVESGGTDPATFAWLDPASLVVTPLQPVPARMRLRMTATAAMQLFFYDEDGVERIDESTGATLSRTVLPAAGPWNGQPFAFWGGAFYFFDVSTSDETDVVRWNPGEATTTLAGHSDALILAAGVSPCAPLQ